MLINDGVRHGTSRKSYGMSLYKARIMINKVFNDGTWFQSLSLSFYLITYLMVREQEMRRFHYTPDYVVFDNVVLYFFLIKHLLIRKYWKMLWNKIIFLLKIFLFWTNAYIMKDQSFKGKCMLCILTRKQVLPTLFPGWNNICIR